MNGEPAALDVTNSSVTATATATAVFIIMKFIHHISSKIQHDTKHNYILKTKNYTVSQKTSHL